MWFHSWNSGGEAHMDRECLGDPFGATSRNRAINMIGRLQKDSAFPPSP